MKTELDEIVQINADIARLIIEIEKLNATIASRKVRINELKLQAMERAKKQTDPHAAKQIIDEALSEAARINVHIKTDTALSEKKFAEFTKLEERRQKLLSHGRLFV